MSSTQFKLTKRGGLTRRINFSSPPSWDVLSHRIHELFHIAVDRVGVSYIDTDQDEITLSSAEELRDYYQAFPSGGKLNVFDLSNEKSLPDTPRTTMRNTFGDIDGEGLPFNIDSEDGWQRLSMPPLGGGIFVPTRTDSPHAFIQVVETDASAPPDDDSASDSASEGRSTADFGGHFTSTLDKGKAKAVDPSSASSVVADDVASMGGWGTTRIETPPARAAPASGTVTPTAEPTPAAGLKEPTETDSTTEDPPLPTIDAASPPQPSLTNDVASLLTTLTNVVSSHPELSEGLRNIIRNATNGGYWNSHRAAVSQAAGDFMHATGEAAEGLRSRAEEEAGARVAEALSGMLRTLSQALGDDAAEHAESTNGAPTEEFGQPWRTSTWYGPPPSWPNMWGAQMGGTHMRGRGGGRGRGGRHHWTAHGPARGGPDPPSGPQPFLPPPAQPCSGNAQAAAEASTAEKAAEVPKAVLVSTGNAKVGYPPLEMYSVPHRHNTYHGYPSRRRIPENSSERVLHSITKRLAAMGITENAHPTLPAKLKEQLPEGRVSEEAENNIVSTLVEELLFMSPKPTASGSGLRNADLPISPLWE
ncbi:hypothetical protein GGX14DRAFT_489251 [Mycena pura]|uniref:PB1 domain-containing protein n=1 Tax=Mycena pura TaxID=153505 RepID=A0AAD6YNZ1_9AGAR|nr:hypothetical protein GGX14DRAFT_489251 [Mycena pura]